MKSIEVRILSGNYKQKKIRHIDSSIRPSLARTRKTIFDTIVNRVGKNFSLLDVFAGSGAIGMEALSIGASKVVFFEIDEKNFRNIKNNLKNFTNIEGSFDVFKTNSLCPPEGSPMDVVFLDPPFDKGFLIKKVLKKLEKYNWIDENTYVIIETHIKEDLDLDEKYFLWKESRIGNVKVSYLAVDH